MRRSFKVAFKDVPEYPQENTNTLSPKDFAAKAAELLLDQKALDTVILDVAPISSIADYLVVCSGTSERHVQGIADKLIERCKLIGEIPVRVSGLDNSNWSIIDFGNVIVHVFYEPTRQFYDFDNLWSKGVKIALPEELQKVANSLRTGLHG